jgi:hypothetical protein
MTDKVCSGCGLAKNKLIDFSIRQQSKKFGRCNQCLEPTYASQKYTPTPTEDRCKRCQELLTAFNKSMTDNSICGKCAARLAGRKHMRELKADYAKQIEEKTLAKKYNQKKATENSGEMIWDIAKEGIGFAYDNERILFRADD